MENLLEGPLSWELDVVVFAPDDYLVCYTEIDCSLNNVSTLKHELQQFLVST